MSDNEKNSKKFSYAAAPYNFIPFPEKVVYRYTLEKETVDKNKEITILPTHDKFNGNLKTGYIDYSIKTLTPLFIDNGNEQFFSVNEKYSIPSSTVRGKIYSNAEILSSSYPEFIEDKKYWHRGCFEGTILKSQYKEFLGLDINVPINQCVRAGYLINRNNKWFIKPAKSVGNKNEQFEIIKEDKLLYLMPYLGEESYMYDLKKYKKNTNKDFWSEVSKLKGKYQNDLLEKYKKPTISRKNQKSSEYFKPYFINVAYYVKSGNVKIKAILNDKYKKFKNFKYGILMNSNNSGNKQVHYLIYEEDEQCKAIEVKQEIINQYKVNVKLKHNEEIASFNFKMAKDKGRMPIFYIVNNDDNKEIISVGFTPYLKIPYKYSIKELLNIKREIPNKEIINLDYVQSIFGFSNIKVEDKTCSLKGRVSFTNAKLNINDDKKEIFEKSTVKNLSQPKATSFQLYLKQENIDERKMDSKINNKEYIEQYITNYKNTLNTYQQKNELRGNKFYWLKDRYDKESVNNKNRNIGSTIKPIKQGCEFKGRIYFENLQEDELGLLLMAIKPFNNAKDNIGKGKPYGYGKVEFKIEDIHEINTENRFKSLNLNYICYDDLENKIKYYNNKFIEKMNSLGQDIDFDTNNRMMAFKLSKLAEKDVNDSEFKYMELRNFKEREPLKDIELYINKEDALSRKYAALEIDDETYMDDVKKLLSKKFNVKTRKSLK